MLSKMLNVRRVLAIAAGGVIGAAIVLAGGFISERIVLGGDDQASRERVQAEVRASFDTMARTLQAMAAPLADGNLIVAAAAEDLTAQRQLFDTADTALAGGGASREELAITIHAADGGPIAWSGRPSELPADRLQGPEAWFFAQGALGLRLVYLLPVTAAGGAHAGAVSAERAFTAASPGATAASRGSADEAFVFPTRFTRVSIALNFESARTQPDADAFEVASPSGGRLLTASLSTLDLLQARERWRRATRAIAIAVLAFALVLLCGPFLDRLARTRRPGGFVGALALCAGAILAGRALLASPALPPSLTSPFDYLATALTLGGLVALAVVGVEAWRLSWHHRRRSLSTLQRRVVYAVLHLAAGGLVALLLTTHFGFIRDTIDSATADLFHFSLYPWDTSRIVLQAGDVEGPAEPVPLRLGIDAGEDLAI